MRLKVIFLACTLYCIAAGKTYSQPALALPFNKKISSENGLSSYNVRKIIQDKYGFIWILTQDGLNRYDGKSFLVYNKSAGSKHQLLGNDIWDVKEDRSTGLLWVVTAYGGLNTIDLKTAEVCGSIQARVTSGAFSDDWLRCMQLCNNDLWIGTYNGLTVYNVKAKQCVLFEPLPFKIKPGENVCIDKIFADEFENVWLFIANHGIVLYSGVHRKVIHFYSISRLSLNEATTFDQFRSITHLAGTGILVGTNQGFRCITYNNAAITNISAGLCNNSKAFGKTGILASSVDAFNNLWFSTSSRLFKADLSIHTITEVTEANAASQEEWLSYINDIFFDKDNNVWLGSRKGVMYTKNTIPVFTPFNVSDDQSVRINHAYYLYPANDSIIYAGTENGLLKVNIYNNKIRQVDKGGIYYFISSFDKKILVSNAKGIQVYSPDKNRFNKASRFYPELKRIDHISINSIAFAADSLAFIGTETPPAGFFIWNYRNRTLKKGNQSEFATLAEANIVNTCYTDRNSMIWVLSDKLITIYNPHNGKSKVIRLADPISHEPYSFFFDIAEAKGDIWIAAYSTGIIQIDSNYTIKKIYTAREGLSNTGVYKVFPVHDSLLYITTNNGLSILNINTGVFKNYFQENGLNSNSFEENCGLYKDGKIYAGGVDGFTIINPEVLAVNNTPPSLYLNNIRVETQAGITDTSSIILQSLTIPADVVQTTLSFSALNFFNPSRTIISYKIKEHNSKWVNLGSQNFINLIGLSYGKYTLLVKAANENGIWNAKPLEITLLYLPKWYQTILFKVSVFTVIVLLLFLFYNYRIGQIKKQQQIRRDIAGDLHDDIGSTLNSLKVFTHLAGIEPQNNTYLAYIEDSIEQATTGLRDMIWVLDDSHDSICELAERIKKFVMPFAVAKNIRFECLVDPEIGNRMLSKKEKRNILLISKESVNNAIKYAECTCIKLSFNEMHHKVTCSIEDDGKGFDISDNIKGNGLKNIVYRAKQIRWKAEIISVREKGTTVKVVKI